MPGQLGVLPGRAILGLVPGPDDVPGGCAEVVMLGYVAGRIQDVAGDVGEREVGDRVPTGLMQQHDVLAVGP
jgi:hypothetical protein